MSDYIPVKINAQIPHRFFYDICFFFVIEKSIKGVLKRIAHLGGVYINHGLFIFFLVSTSFPLVLETKIEVIKIFQ